MKRFIASLLLFPLGVYLYRNIHTPLVRVVHYDTPAPYDTIVVWPEVGR
jgi:hypothetical protein